MAHAAQHTVIQAGNAGTPELFTTIGEVVSISGPNISHEAIDVTNLDSAGKEYIAAGIYDGAEVGIEVLWYEANSQQAALVTSARAGTQRNYQICWSNLDGTDKAFAVGDVNAGADTIAEAGHLLTTGQPIRFSTDDTLPDPLVAGVTYYTIWTDANTIQVATTNGNAIAGTQINLIDGGAGNHNITVGDRYSFTASISGAVPSGAQSDTLTGTFTFKITGALSV